MKIIVIISFILSVTSHVVESRDLFKEMLIRGIDVDPEIIIVVCDNENEWCRGYITAAVHALKVGGTKLCLPTNNVDRQNDKGLWSIIEAYLYRLPKDIKINLYQSIIAALTEHKDC